MIVSLDVYVYMAGQGQEEATTRQSNMTAASLETEEFLAHAKQPSAIYISRRHSSTFGFLWSNALLIK